MLQLPENIRYEGESIKERVKTDTLLRETATNYIRLIGDADRKARIILVVNTIFLTISISLLNRQALLDSYVWISVLILLLSNLVTLFYSIKSVKPEFREQKTEQCRENILHYCKCRELTLEEYDTAIRDTMKDKEKKMDSLIRDLYFYGNLLHIKYRLLGIAYRLFSWGIFLTVFSYLLILLVNKG
jgi:heme exporter protein D